MSKKTVEKIIESGNEYVIQVKRNQKTLFKEIERVMVEEQPLDTFEIEEKGHGRHSFWSVTVFNALNSEKSNEWKGLKRFIHVHKEVFYTNIYAKKKLQITIDSIFLAKDFLMLNFFIKASEAIGLLKINYTGSKMLFTMRIKIE